MFVAIATVLSVIAGFVLGNLFSAWTHVELQKVKVNTFALAQAVQGDFKALHTRVLALESKLGTVVTDAKNLAN